MSNDLHFPAGGRNEDEELGRLLRPLYAPPADEGYWQGLEARILDRVRAERTALGDGAVVGRIGAGIGAGIGAAIRGDDGGEWWVVLSQWARVGLAAAVVIAVVTGTLMLQHQRQEARMAAETLLADPASIYTMQLPGEGVGEAPPRVSPTLRYGVP